MLYIKRIFFAVVFLFASVCTIIYLGFAFNFVKDLIEQPAGFGMLLLAWQAMLMLFLWGFVVISVTVLSFKKIRKIGREIALQKQNIIKQ
jgi:hypothetical protein